MKMLLKVFRGDGQKASYKEYEIPLQEGMVVLDAIHHIQAKEDNNLAVRWNCKAGKCGSCSAEVNGIPKLLCMTRLDQYPNDQPLTVSPMKAFPVIKDLVCDVSWNYEVNKKIPPFKPGPREKDGTWRMQQREIDRCQEFRKCIECFLCQDVCHVIRNHKKESFAGPRFLVRLASLEMHPLDIEDRLPLVKEKFGLGLCNITKCCTEVCPEGITITDNAIIPLKERVVTRYYDPIAKLFRKLFPALFGFWIFFGAWSLELGTSAQAATPPIPQEELEDRAELIVRGTVSEVKCESKQLETVKCGTKVRYTALLAIDSILKQPKGSFTSVSFHFTRVQYNKGCTGDQDHFANPGETGTYYLRRGKGPGWYLLNWSAAQIEKEGDSSKVPPCPSAKK